MNATIVLVIRPVLTHNGLTLLFLKVEYINELSQREMRKNSHYSKPNDKVYIEMCANTNTLKSEMILKNNY